MSMTDPGIVERLCERFLLPPERDSKLDFFAILLRPEP